MFDLFKSPIAELQELAKKPKAEWWAWCNQNSYVSLGGGRILLAYIASVTYVNGTAYLHGHGFSIYGSCSVRKAMAIARRAERVQLLLTGKRVRVWDALKLSERGLAK